MQINSCDDLMLLAFQAIIWVEYLFLFILNFEINCKFEDIRSGESW